MAFSKVVLSASLSVIMLGGCAPLTHISSEQLRPEISPIDSRTALLVNSCDLPLDQRIAATESVMEIVVRNTVDLKTGKMRKDADIKMMYVGQQLYDFHVKLNHTDADLNACRVIANEIRTVLLEHLPS